MSYDRWHHPALKQYHCKLAGDDYVDFPRTPVWLSEDDALDLKKLFSRLRGFVSYGSPLETFARTWPAIVQLNLTAIFSEKFEWLNFYDPVDFVASPLSSFSKQIDVSHQNVKLVDVPVRSSINIVTSHVKYVGSRRVMTDLIAWMMHPEKWFVDVKQYKSPSRFRIFGRHLAAALQGLVLLFFGGLLWPFSILAVAAALQFILGRVF
jgi:hypothetical protein